MVAQADSPTVWGKEPSKATLAKLFDHVAARAYWNCKCSVRGDLGADHFLAVALEAICDKRTGIAKANLARVINKKCHQLILPGEIGQEGS